MGARNADVSPTFVLGLMAGVTPGHEHPAPAPVTTMASLKSKPFTFAACPERTAPPRRS